MDKFSPPARILFERDDEQTIVSLTRLTLMYGSQNQRQKFTLFSAFVVLT